MIGSRRALVAFGVSVVLARPAPVAAQRGAPPAGDARYAARRTAAYERLGPNLLVVQSRWAPKPAGQAGFDQDATFYYFTGAERLMGALLVLDGSTRRPGVRAERRQAARWHVPSGSAPTVPRAWRGRDIGLERVRSYLERWLADHPRG